MTEKKPFRMHRCGIIITYRCNLKCKLCTAYSPYYDIPPHYKMADLKKPLDTYFQMIDHVEKFTVSGGEPFVHSELDQIMGYIFRYEHKIGFVEIITNGSIMANERLVKVLTEHRDKIRVLVDHYGEQLSVKVGELKACFDEADIPYQIREQYDEGGHCGGWIDFGDFTEKHSDEKGTIEKFIKCAIPQRMKYCFTIKGHEIHPCGPSYRCIELGVTEKDSKEYIDLYEPISAEQQMEKIQRMYELKYLHACKYCNGMCDDSIRYTPAEQLEE